MSLFPEENIITKEIESWKVFTDNLKSEEDKKLFLETLEKCQKYSIAINAKGNQEGLVICCAFAGILCVTLH